MSELERPGSPSIPPTSESVEKEVQTIIQPSINPLRAIRRKEMELRKASQRQREELSRMEIEERGREDEFSVFLHTAVEMDATKRIAQQSLEAVNRSTYFIPSLVDLCAREIASHFHEMDLGGVELPEELVEKIVPHLAEDIPLVYSVPLITSEEYWKRVGKRRDPSMELRDRETTWKQLVMERIVEETLEKDMPLNPELVHRALQGLSEVIKDYVRCVSVRQLRSHISPAVLTACFPNLKSLSLSYGVLREGMGFDMSMCGIRDSDCVNIANMLKEESQTLQHLGLRECMMTDIQARVIVSGLVATPCLLSLDLSHNRIRDDGLRAIASFLAVNTTLIDLNLSNNFLRAESGRFLAAALEKNTSLQSLNLRLNRFGDEGGRLLLSGLRSNPSLNTLDISSNELGPESAIILCDLFEAQGCVLRSVNISNNVLGSAIGERLANAVKKYKDLIRFDVRMTDLDGHDLVIIQEQMKKRKVKEENLLLLSRDFKKP
eukprot:TRINITY_DN2168_c0_g1_i1.p1 TRINITY_DN2168_c0_g1~~TRINITY_DN2168_c0_g1_i1.p1  ORF type:complete len:493 (+),score=118.24 TRINITY_DN2168_c0_g1_i1:107-1585(+)